MCWQHHNKSPAALFLLQSYESWMFTPLHCSPPFPTFGMLPGHIALPSPMLWSTPLFSLFVCSCLDYWNALLFAVSSPAQSNDCSGTGVSAEHSPWHQTRRPVQSLIRQPCFPNNSQGSLLLTISSVFLKTGVHIAVSLPLLISGWTSATDVWKSSTCFQFQELQPTKGTPSNIPQWYPSGVF